MGTVFQRHSDALTITRKSVRVGAAQSMAVAERYHAPVRRTCRILEHETKDLDDELAFLMAVNSVGNTVGL